jgi:hypothetical protein
VALPWAPSEIGLIEGGGGVRPAILLRIATDPVIRLWSGATRDLTIETDPVETELGATYRSMGALTDIPSVNQLLNGEAERVTFGLSGAGVTAEVLALASSEAASIRGVRVNLGAMFFDANWQRGTPVVWPWEGEADSLAVEWEAGDGTPIRSIALSVGSLMTGRRRPQISVWTDADQRRRSAGDAFFSEVRRYSEGSTKAWPI